MTRRRLPRGQPRRTERGMTIVELLIAIIILSVGILALASSAAGTSRMIGAGGQQMVAAQLAQSRIEQLRATACTSAASGSETNRGVYTQWTVATATRARTLTVLVRYARRGGGTTTRTFTSVIAC